MALFHPAPLPPGAPYTRRQPPATTEGRGLPATRSQEVTATSQHHMALVAPMAPIAPISPMAPDAPVAPVTPMAPMAHVGPTGPIPPTMVSPPTFREAQDKFVRHSPLIATIK